MRTLITQEDKDILEAQTTCAHCSDEKGFQPVDKPTLDMIATEKKGTSSLWYKQFPWLTVCLTYKKYCLYYCRYATQHSLLSFTKMEGEDFH